MYTDWLTSVDTSNHSTPSTHLASLEESGHSVCLRAQQHHHMHTGVVTDGAHTVSPNDMAGLQCHINRESKPGSLSTCSYTHCPSIWRAFNATHTMRCKPGWLSMRPHTLRVP
jgi:hypothetical protein